jgi:hypothetical protein
MGITKKSMRGRKFNVLRIIKGAAIEDIPTIRKNIKAAITGIPEAVLTETETSFELNNGQFFMKPKQKRETAGTLTCGATFADFEGCRIEYKDMILNDNFFETGNAFYTII